MPERVRVGIIGVGGIYRAAHLAVYPDLPSCRLVALCDSVPETLEAGLRATKELYLQKVQQALEKGDQETAERLRRDMEEIRPYQITQEMLRTASLDLVDICTQPNQHTPLTVAALEAGVHVMCEKPMARTWLDCAPVIDAVKRTGRLYQYSENWLWEPMYYTARKLIAAGAIGEPVMVFLAAAHGGPEANPWVWNPANGGGGSLVDNGIHALGASWYLCGFDRRPTLVKAADPIGIAVRIPQRIIYGRYQSFSVEDDGHILIRFEHRETGAWSTAHVEGSWSLRDSPETAIIGTTGRIRFAAEEGCHYAVVEDAHGSTRRYQVSGPCWEYWPSSFYGEIRNMVECVRHGARSISDEHFGAECSAVIGAAYLSQKRGRKAVSVDAFKRFALDIARRFPDSAEDELVRRLLPG